VEQVNKVWVADTFIRVYKVPLFRAARQIAKAVGRKMNGIVAETRREEIRSGNKERKGETITFALFAFPVDAAKNGDGEPPLLSHQHLFCSSAGSTTGAAKTFKSMFVLGDERRWRKKK